MIKIKKIEKNKSSTKNKHKPLKERFVWAKNLFNSNPSKTIEYTLQAIFYIIIWGVLFRTNYYIFTKYLPTKNNINLIHYLRYPLIIEIIIVVSVDVILKKIIIKQKFYRSLSVIILWVYIIINNIIPFYRIHREELMCSLNEHRIITIDMYEQNNLCLPVK